LTLSFWLSTLDSRLLTLDFHIIRLRGPWHVEPVCRFVPRADGGFDSRTDNLPAAGRANMPADWGEVFGREFLGRVRFHRNFNLPTGLAAGDKVWLVVEPPRSQATVHVAGELLGQVAIDEQPARFEISQLLATHNLLEIVVEHAAADAELRPGGLVGEVRLEIESHR
jgi:hypothetical protein